MVQHFNRKEVSLNLLIMQINHCICFLTFRTLQGSVKMSEVSPALPRANRYPFIKFLPSLAVCMSASSVRMGYMNKPGLKSGLDRFKHMRVISCGEAAESRGMISGCRTREAQV